MTRASTIALQAIITAIFVSAMIFLGAAISRAADAPATWFLVINVGFNGVIGDSHTVTSTSMPQGVCLDMANKLNLPLLLPRLTHVAARCENELPRAAQ
jgi:hypothetical protein